MALLLYSSLNDKMAEDKRLHLNENIVNTSRQTLFKTKRAHNSKIGLNSASNRFSLSYDKICII
jgi:hypothetical protein